MRFPLRFIPGNLALPILQGRLRGRKWLVGSGTHGCWLGSYEYEKRRVFEKLVTPGSIVFDIGAHAGFYTLLASQLVGGAGRVVAFEPAPWNLHFLRAHLRINNIGNVTVIEAAVGGHSGIGLFEPGGNSSTGRLSSEGQLKVRVVSLDDLLTGGEVPMPHFIKMDIEGAELLALNGAKSMLGEGGPTLFLATHGQEVHRQCCDFLSSLGYSLEPIAARSLGDATELLAQKRG